MKYIDNAEQSVEQIKNKRTMYDAKGNETDKQPLAIAHSLQQKFSDGTESRTFYVSTINGLLYDPLGMDSNKKKNMNFLLKLVHQQTFDYYIMYLQSNNSLYLTRAQRSFING